ncbi:MAG: hypothetical protein LPK85_10890 [Gammaproteobacteria bacterium]|nr:hypothetical protein [Gammaproteobacteria bacterium]
MLLKSLWRRAHRGESDTRQDGGDPASSPSLLARLTHLAEHHLERLQTLIELRFAQSYNLKDDTAVRALIHFASRIQDQDIQKELLLFYLNCTPDVQEFLRTGDLVDAGHAIRRAPPTWSR